MGRSLYSRLIQIRNSKYRFCTRQVVNALKSFRTFKIPTRKIFSKYFYDILYLSNVQSRPHFNHFRNCIMYLCLFSVTKQYWFSFYSHIYKISLNYYPVWPRHNDAGRIHFRRPSQILKLKSFIRSFRLPRLRRSCVPP